VAINKRPDLKRREKVKNIARRLAVVSQCQAIGVILMNRYLAAAALAVSSLLSSAKANAATVINFLDLGATQVALFGNSDPQTGNFTDQYTFTIPAGTLDGYVGSIGFSLFQTNLEFGSITLNGQNVFNVVSDSGPLEARNLTNFLTSGGPQSLIISGRAQRFASYGGSFTLTEATAAAVPEPATWAMMLLGFGVIGAAMRRKSAPQPKVRYGF
jgi:hypothetical protein